MMANTSIVLVCLIGCAIAGVERCPSNLPRTQYLKQFRTSCYEYHLGQSETWEYANLNCKARGGYLVSINSESEQADVFNGLQLLNSVKDIWIGLYDGDGDAEGKWKWASGEAVKYQNWATDQPGMIGGMEDCAVMDHGDSGYWHDYPCKDVLFVKYRYGWVCEYPL